MSSPTAPDEQQLRALGVYRLPIPVPFPQAGGPVNVYLVELADGDLLQLDSGLETPEALAALEAGFAALGRSFHEVRRIVLTHGHVDHFGAARHVQERHGGLLPVAIHPADRAKVAADGPRWRDVEPVFAAYLQRLGVPASALPEIGVAGEHSLGFSRRLERPLTLSPGEVITTRHLALEVLAMPGHTPGCVCLLDRTHGLLFAGDHLLERVSPNPLMDLGPDGTPQSWKPLLAYLDSLSRTRALDVHVVLPGHGAPFAGHRALIDTLVGFYGKRQAKLRRLLGAGARTGLELLTGLFSWAEPRDYFLAMSETVANLDALEARGEVVREDRNGLWSFRLAG
jgi:glyoxylase-like metal-dependent hydrolase (beta-lactamase superfamily II)